MIAALGIVALVLAVAGVIAAQLVGQYQRAPWCWCGHHTVFHQHDRHGDDCSQCSCPRFGAPWIRRLT